MLQLKLATPDKLEITDRKTTLTLSGKEITLLSNTITSPGEYEEGGVEVVYGEQAALLVWERLQIAYVFTSGSMKQFDRDQFSSADALLISPAVAALSKEQLNELIEEYDPSLVLVNRSTALDENQKTTLKFQEVPLVKISEQTLPTEGREYYQIG